MISYEKGIHEINNRKMEYITFGQGEPLLIIPGIGDGLTTIATRAVEEFMFYFNYAANYRVITASRAEPVQDNASIESMAQEYISLMKHLGYDSYYLIGKSMGGMIAQHMANLEGEKIKKAVFAVTVPYTNNNLHRVVEAWTDYALKEDYIGLKSDMYYKTHFPAKALMYTNNMFLTSFFYWPKDFSRFIRQAAACHDFDSRDILPNIQVPSLVIIGSKDTIMLPKFGKELAGSLPGSKLVVLKNTGHGAFDDKKYEFDREVFEFLNVS